MSDIKSLCRLLFKQLWNLIQVSEGAMDINLVEPVIRTRITSLAGGGRTLEIELVCIH